MEIRFETNGNQGKSNLRPKMIKLENKMVIQFETKKGDHIETKNGDYI